MRHVVALAPIFLAAPLLAPLLTSDAAHATPRPTPAGHQHVAVVPADDPYFAQDPKKPRVLKSKQPGRIDRGYVERFAMPRIPKAVLDELDAHRDPQVEPPPPLQVPDAPLAGSLFAANSVHGRVFVVEGTNQMVINTQQGVGFDHNGNGAQAVIGAVLQALGDNYDFVSVFTTFSDANVAAYYFPIKQDIDGLGECNTNTGETFGCIFDQFNGQLQGFVFMNSLETWQESDRNYDGVVHPFDSFDSGVFSTLGQEVAHRWGSGLRFVDPRTGTVSKKLLGRDNSHWSAFVDTDASVMDGWDWTQAGDGDFDLVGDMERYSTLDLYTMGAVPVASAQPFFWIDNAVFDVRGVDRVGINGQRVPADIVLQLPSVALMDSIGMDVHASGARVDLTIQDIVDAEGNRCPDPDHTQKTFKQAVVLVTRPGQTAASVQGTIDQLETVMTTWERWWSDRTGKRLKLCTDLSDDCVLAELEMGGGTVTFDGDAFQPGGAATLHLHFTAKNADVTGAKVALSVSGKDAALVDAPGSVDVGDIAAGQSKDIDIPIGLKADYPCGSFASFLLTTTSDNAADVSGEVPFFPGQKALFASTFADGADGFVVNALQSDTATRTAQGALALSSIDLSCDMSKRSPERDYSLGDASAWVTAQGTDHVSDLIDGDGGPGAELNGLSSLMSPVINTKGALSPEIVYAFWLDGADGDRMSVQISGDGGETYKEARVHEDFAHGWRLARLNVREVLGTVPDNVVVLFTFEGHGRLEGGIDDVYVLDYTGSCSSAAGVCGCDAQGRSTPQSALLVVAAALGLRRLRRRARGA